ncbi:NRX2A protein, partial [Locustella ochotensis]|nr:NRX2A protein [Locustella ochotensis]
MTCPAAEGPPAPGGRPETRAHLGPPHRGPTAPPGSEGRPETRAHLDPRGSTASGTSTASQDHRETVTHLGPSETHLGSSAHPGSVADQSLVGNQDHPEPGTGPVVLLDSEVSRGSKEHLGPVTHLEMRAPQEPVPGPGAVGSQDHPEPPADVPLDSKVAQGFVARSGPRGHQDLAPSQASEGPQEPKVTQGPVANRKTKVNQSPTAPAGPRVSEDPVLCLDLRVRRAPEANRDPVDHPDPQARQAPVALTDWKFHRAPADPQETKGQPGPPAPRVPGVATAEGGHPQPRLPFPAPRPCPRAPSGARLGLVLLTLGSLLLPCARASALEFGGAPGQWARYGRWAPGSGGQLSFRLKTNVTRALLLYLDDGGNCDFLELLVAEGRLRLRFAIACAEPATLEPPA